MKEAEKPTKIANIIGGYLNGRVSMINGEFVSYLPDARSNKLTLSPITNKDKTKNLQNLRLAKRLSEIKGRKSIFDFSEDEKNMKILYNRRMTSKRQLKQLRQRDLSEQNKNMVDRIMKKRNHKYSFSFFNDAHQKPKNSLNYLPRVKASLPYIQHEKFHSDY